MNPETQRELMRLLADADPRNQSTIALALQSVAASLRQIVDLLEKMAPKDTEGCICDCAAERHPYRLRARSKYRGACVDCDCAEYSPMDSPKET